MNRPPEIFVDTGFEVDQNGALEEIVIPKVVRTCNAPRKITFEGENLNYLLTKSTTLQEFSAPNCKSVSGNLFTGGGDVTYSFPSLVNITDDSSALFASSRITSINMPALKSISSTGTYTGQFYNCTSLTSVSMDSLESMTTNGGNNGTFGGCTNLSNVSFNSLQSISSTAGAANYGPFAYCTSLVIVSLPKLKTVYSGNPQGGVFTNCTGLQSVTLGSSGNHVSSLSASVFLGCTQTGLTITIYTADGNALAHSPFGATNATIVWEEA